MKMEICDGCGKEMKKACFKIREINLDEPALEFRSRYYCKQCLSKLNKDEEEKEFEEWQNKNDLELMESFIQDDELREVKFDSFCRRAYENGEMR